MYKPFPRNKNYLIFDDGAIYSLYSKKFLNQYLDREKRYFIVTLCIDRKPTKFRVHRLVAEAFIPNLNNLPQVNHKNENTFINSVDNLEWCTASYNVNYGTRIERQKETLRQTLEKKKQKKN